MTTKLSAYYHLKDQLDQMVTERTVCFEEKKSKLQYINLLTKNKIDLKKSDKTMYLIPTSSVKQEGTRNPQSGCGKARPIGNDHESVNSIMKFFKGE